MCRYFLFFQFIIGRDDIRQKRYTIFPIARIHKLLYVPHTILLHKTDGLQWWQLRRLSVLLYFYEYCQLFKIYSPPTHLPKTIYRMTRRA